MKNFENQLTLHNFNRCMRIPPNIAPRKQTNWLFEPPGLRGLQPIFDC